MNHDVVWQNYAISMADRVHLLEQQPFVLWFTGLPGAGKTTLANVMAKRLHDLRRHAYVLDGDNLRIQCRVNDRTDVDDSSSGMIFGVAELVSWVSEVMVLHPGDIICSGCPSTGEIEVGDTVEVEIEGIGTLRNPVVADR